VGDVIGRLDGWDLAVVVAGRAAGGGGGAAADGAGGIVLGVLSASRASDADPSSPVGDAMATAPSTFRPSITRRELAEWMDGRHGASSRRTLLTTLDGRLVGVVCREDL
jgi:hypothetical protein